MVVVNTKTRHVTVEITRGPKGAAFTYEDFTPEQLDGLKLRFENLTDNEKNSLKMRFEELTPEEKEELSLKWADLTESQKEELKLQFSDLTAGEKEALSLKFTDLTENQKDELRFKYSDFTPEQIEAFKLKFDDLTPEEKESLVFRFEDLTQGQKDEFSWDISMLQSDGTFYRQGNFIRANVSTYPQEFSYSGNQEFQLDFIPTNFLHVLGVREDMSVFYPEYSWNMAKTLTIETPLAEGEKIKTLYEHFLNQI